ncbi:MAG: hypothetical protein ABSE18_00695 [Minisyncoccia bacterium]
MEANQLEKYKRELEKERLLLLAEIKQNERPVDFGNETNRPEEETDEVEEIGNQMAVAQDLKNRLAEIDAALAKIYNGKYGACEQCGRTIETAVLDVDPESRFCKHCKSGK